MFFIDAIPAPIHELLSPLPALERTAEVEIVQSNAQGKPYFQPAKVAHHDFNYTGGSWLSFDQLPRQVADVNGDGRADIVGFGGQAVYVALGQGDGTFAQHFVAHGNFNTTGGSWSSFDEFPRQMADVNGDGRADIIGFGEEAVYVALGQGDGTFAQHFVAHGNFNTTGGSWSSFNEFPRQVADVNGDGRADIIGFGEEAVYVALGQGDGTFAQHFVAHGNFNTTGGSWSSFNEFPRQVADVNGDGRADIIGFGSQAVYVALGQGDGTFSQHFIASYDFSSDAALWDTFDQAPRQLGDINGDGRADIVGFGDDAVYVSLGQANGTFSAMDAALDNFISIGRGWVSQDQFPRQVADVNGDGRADIVGFGRQYTFTSLATPSDTLVGFTGND